MKATLEFQKDADAPITIELVGGPEEVTDLIQLIRSFAKEKKWVEL